MAFDEHLLHDTIQAAAVMTAAVGIVLLLIAGAAELLRRQHATSRFVALADRLVPSALHRTAIAVLSVLAGVVSLTGGHPAAADESIRDWLSPTTTTVTGAVPDPSTTPSTSTSVPAPDPEQVTEPPSPTAPRAHRTGRWVRDAEPRHPPTTTTSTTTTTTTTSSVPSRATTPGPVPSRRSQPDPKPPVRPTRPARATTDPAPPPVAPAPGAPAATSSQPTNPSYAYTVGPGDCLWDIAASYLPTNATNADIDGAWRAIYAANRDAIGADPNLIHPGLVLTWSS